MASIPNIFNSVSFVGIVLLFWLVGVVFCFFWLVGIVLLIWLVVADGAP